MTALLQEQQRLHQGSEDEYSALADAPEDDPASPPTTKTRSPIWPKLGAASSPTSPTTSTASTYREERIAESNSSLKSIKVTGCCPSQWLRGFERRVTGHIRQAVRKELRKALTKRPKKGDVPSS